jgi:hypothetical protein
MMYRKSAIAAVLLVSLLLAPIPTTRDAAACDTCCFNVRIEYRGREAVKIVDNVQYYRWTYRVYGTNCINTAMSRWVLDMCTDKERQLSEISTQSVDSSDPSNGTTTYYQPAFGKDTATGHTGLRWVYQSGNAINKVNEYDEFSFVASGIVTQVHWAAKSSCGTVCGTTWGPGCCPVATETATWGWVKTLYR